MSDLITNANPKHNPVTSILGGVFILISGAMYIIKYIMPVFIVFKQELPYEWYTPLCPLGLGLLLIFINDEYFMRIFNRGEKIVSKVSGTDKEEK